MAEKWGVPLVSIEGFPEAAISRLAELWITTAEELVSAARQEGGPRGLAEHLDLQEDELRALVEQAASALPPEISFALDEPMSVGMGALDEPEEDDLQEEPVSFSPTPLPAQVDLHARMQPVRSQGGRGTCAAHACVAVLEFLLGEEGASCDLSEQFLYWNCKQHDLTPGEGTWLRVAMNRLQQDGVCTEQQWPYNPKRIEGNEGQGPPPEDARENAAAYRITNWERLRPRWVNLLRQTLAANKPVAFVVPVYTYWLMAPVRRSGDIRMPLSTDKVEGGHAMCMVGYEDDPEVPGGGFFHVRNSWGSRWAQNSPLAPGHARIPYAYVSRYGRAALAASLVGKAEGAGDGAQAAWLHRLWERFFGA